MKYTISKLLSVGVIILLAGFVTVLAPTGCVSDSNGMSDDGVDGTSDLLPSQTDDDDDNDTSVNCSVTDNGDGSVTINCPDGTSATLHDGLDGSDGQDGTSCRIVENGDGSKTISCDDDTTVTIYDGADGSSCSVVDNLDGTATINCDDSTSSTISGVSDLTQEIIFPDTNLETAIRDTLYIASSEPIRKIDMYFLSGFNLLFHSATTTSDAILNLSGLENATRSEFIGIRGFIEYFGGFEPSTTEPVGEIEYYNFGLSDLSPLAELFNLRRLNLDYNNISDFTTFVGLYNLYELSLRGNNISDLSTFAGMVFESQTCTFILEINNISDISPFENISFHCDNLRLLLSHNNISDLTPLVNNSDITGNVRLDLYNNPLSSDAINTQIPALQARGVNVSY